MPSSDSLSDQNKKDAAVSIHQQKRSETTGEIGRGLRKARRGRREADSERNNEPALTRIYPRDVTRSPPSIIPSRFPQSSTSASNGQVPQSKSPLLSGLNYGPVSPGNLAAQRTSEWTKSLPFSGSPPNGPVYAGLSMNGSPPNAPSTVGHSVAGMTYVSPSPSPPTGGNPRGLSQQDNFQSFGYHLSERPDRTRPTSMYSQYSPQLQHGGSPPLPHQPQAHFYTAPELDIPLSPNVDRGIVAGENGYYCGFDSLAESGHAPSEIAETVLMMGWQGGVDVCKVEKDKLDVIGRLRLRGAVIGAKILPSRMRQNSLAALRPLIALIIHGAQAGSDPVLKDDTVPSADEHDVQDGQEEISHYQTSVEVYSLSTFEHVATLFTCPPVPITRSRSGRLVQPDPSGDLRIEADGNYVVVGSGTSGEVFMFELNAHPRGQESFRCVGKVWTSVHMSSPDGSSSTSSVADSDSQDGTHGPDTVPRRTALFSLRGRWLAIVPPFHQTQSSLHGQALLAASLPKPAGVLSGSPTSQPPITCEVESVEGESMFNRVAREVTQEAIRGARWVAGQGMQAWHYYTRRSPPNAPSPQLPLPRDYDFPTTTTEQHGFPPTHAQVPASTSHTRRDPVVVSILDLRKHVVTHAHTAAPPEPVATFPTPFGCSHISFSPNGLALLTASQKGDVQIVWDLLRMAHGRSAVPSAEHRMSSNNAVAPQAPKVREVARFTRMTVANIVDVVWNHPNGESLAILTEKGTVHIFDLPPTAFQWPPPRRLTQPVVAPSDASSQMDGSLSDPIDVRPGSNAVAAAMRAMSNRAQPILNAARGHRSSISSIPGFSGLGQTASATGGRVVAAGFSKSLNAASGTVHHLRHVGENRLHLPGQTDLPSLGRVKWLNRKDRRSLAVVSGGLLRIYEVEHRARKKGEKKSSSVVGKAVEYTLPRLSERSGDHPRTNEGKKCMGPDSPMATASYWTLSSSASLLEGMTPGNDQPLSYAEIETNAPYQPFHTDRRIGLFVYELLDPPHLESPLPRASSEPESDISQLKSTTANEAIPWVFGEDIPATKLNLTVANEDSDEDGGAVLTDDLVADVQRIRSWSDNTRGDPLVVTTRRRRGIRLASEDENFFEDDCEVLDFAEDRV